jgi:class 3 adenylate cyclase/tetratricopeptide (TPR) repeat protein
VSGCPSCGADNPNGARFCSDCGAALRPEPEESRGEERRVVTILFVDLVGFTERSDRADPEDVRRTLLPFHATVKENLERFGGTLDKFIGDAVMGVFGAPVAHEDDPVRAVRAALRILRSIEELRRTDPELAVRIAVNTGEAVVSFGRGPQVGEAVTGDVVNTASRMQSLAPKGSVVVGGTTRRALRDRFEMEPIPPATVKGKAEPLSVWRVVGEREVTADLTASEYVGREPELSMLEDLFDRAALTPTIHTVAVVGEPGLGKSRLVGELGRRIGSRARRLTGRCLPYGEGVTLAPVAQTIRAVAGIRSTDDSVRITEQLALLAEGVERDKTERRWLASRLASVLGVSESDSGSAISSRETADAWARVLAYAASGGPLIVLIEDLHWADAATIEVVEDVAEELVGRPVLFVVTARPDLLEHHEGWAAGHKGRPTIQLAPLAEDETERLIYSLLEQAEMHARSAPGLLERVGGNPLFALEFVRMLGERAAEVAEGLPTPDTVQAAIAARLDGIPFQTRRFVHDAAVIGDEFWLEALAAMAGRPGDDVRESVDALVRRGVVEPRPTSSLANRQSYGFTHALIREIAYERLPRGERARRHLAVAEWLERAAVPPEEHAEALSRHLAAAVELGEASGEAEVVTRARLPAVRWLTAAGDRAANVDAAAAFTLYDRALTIAQSNQRERLDALARSAITGRRGGRLEAPEVLARYEEGLSTARELDDPALIGEWLTRVGSQLGAMGEAARSRDALAEALRLLEALPPGRSLARAYAYRAEEEMFAGHTKESIDLAERGLALLRGGGDDLVVMLLHIRGDARCATGDTQGLDDLREALRLAEEAHDATAVVLSRTYLGEWRSTIEGPRAALEEFEEGLELSTRRGLTNLVQWTKTHALDAIRELGDWDLALALCDELLSVPEDRLDPLLRVRAHATRAAILLARGRWDPDVDADEVLAVARRLEELQGLVPALIMAAALAVAGGRNEDGVARLEELERVTSDVAPEYRASELARIVRLSIDAGAVDLAERLVEGSEPRAARDRLQQRAAEAALAEARGQEPAANAYAQVANGWRERGNPYEEALALLGQARCVGAANRAIDPGVVMARGLELLRTLGVHDLPLQGAGRGGDPS